MTERNERIAKIRREKGLTQQKLGEEVGATQGAVAHWESGRRQPPLAMLRKIAEALGVDVRDLI